MKVLFLNISQGKAERGAETFVSEVSERLKKNHKVMVLGAGKIPPLRWPFLWRFFIDPHGLAILKFTIASLSAIWREKADIVIPLNGGWQPALVRLVTWLYGGKMVISGQSGKGWYDRNNLWTFPDAFASLSTRLAKWAKGVNPFVQVEYIPNGVNLDKFGPNGRAIKFELEKPVILAVGALTSEKRLDLAIKAVARLGKGSLVIAGRGPLREELILLGRRLLGAKRFHIEGFDFDAIGKAYRGAQVFTLPSPWYRSFEIAIVEAMASGLPVVVNDDPIRREIVGDAGLFVDPTDTDAYSKALESALNAKWGDKPRKQAEKFSWDKIAEKYEKLFKAL